MSAKDSQIFVGNLDLSTSRKTLQKYFSKYGYVKTLIVPWNAEKKCIRGFAFVHYEDSEAVNAALAETQTHMIDGVKVQVRRKNAKLNQVKAKTNPDKSKPDQDKTKFYKNEFKPNQDKYKAKQDNSVTINQDFLELNQDNSELYQNNSELNVNKSKLYKEIGEEEHKIFVGGLSSSFNCTTLRQHFNQFGRVKQVSVPWNIEKHCNKGFGFVQFEDAETFEAALTSYHEIDGVHIKVRIYKRESLTSHASYNSNDEAQTAFARPYPDRGITPASGSAIYNGVAPAAVPKTNRQATNDGLNGKKKTVCAYHLEGDVDIPEICVYSITSSCKHHISGCRRLHAKCSMQWQFYNNDHWYNFKDFQSKGLEEAFLNPDSDGTNIIPIVSTRTPTNKAVTDLKAILGDYSWKADFDEMNISVGLGCLSYDIRRLSTVSSVISRNKLATSYEWYFKDEYGKFIKYGNASTAGKVEHLPDVTSEDIEIKFVKEKLATFEFNSPSYTYVIDFNEMTQTNQSTLVSRQVRRRPNPLNISDTDTPQNSILPSYWAPENKKLISEQFALKPSDSEFQKFKSIFTRELPKYNVVKIERNQNSYLWTAYQNKKQYVLKKNGGTNVNEMYLFHGTHTKNVKAICEQNMDWRLHGSNVGQVYGRGSYFSNSASFSADYCNSDTDEKVIFIVKVIVGTTTRGDSSMTRPPTNNLTSSLYDTTVDDVASPKVFVKYDSQEYYPEYIVTYKPTPVQPAYYSSYSSSVVNPSSTRLLPASRPAASAASASVQPMYASRPAASAASASVQPMYASRPAASAAYASVQSISASRPVASAASVSVQPISASRVVSGAASSSGHSPYPDYFRAQIEADMEAQNRAMRLKKSSSESKGCSVM